MTKISNSSTEQPVISNPNGFKPLTEPNKILFHPERYAIMKALYRDRTQSRSEMSKTLNINSSSLYRHLGKLENANFIETKYGQIDSKIQRIVSILPKGYRIFEKYFNVSL